MTSSCMEARILAVADVVEAMASYRPYRPSPKLTTLWLASLVIALTGEIAVTHASATEMTKGTHP